LGDVLEDIQEGIKHKNPQVRTETLRFLVRCLQTTPFTPLKTEVQIIGETSTKLLADTFEPTRNAAAEALGTLMKIIGERPMIQFLDGIDEIRKTKIKEFFEKAQVKARPRPQSKSAAPPSKGKVHTTTSAPATTSTKPSGNRPSAIKSAAVGSTVKRPVSASSMDKEPESPRKPAIVRPGVKLPAAISTTSTGHPAAAGSRLPPRQSTALRSGSPAPAASISSKRSSVEEHPAGPPKLGRQLGRVSKLKYYLIVVDSLIFRPADDES
jgi:protein STU2